MNVKQTPHDTLARQQDLAAAAFHAFKQRDKLPKSHVRPARAQGSLLVALVKLPLPNLCYRQCVLGCKWHYERPAVQRVTACKCAQATEGVSANSTVATHPSTSSLQVRTGSPAVERRDTFQAARSSHEARNVRATCRQCQAGAHAYIKLLITTEPQSHVTVCSGRSSSSVC